MKIGAPSPSPPQEVEKIYWCVVDKKQFFGDDTQHILGTSPQTTFEQLLSKVRAATERTNVYKLKYSRGEKYSNVIINNDESMWLAIKYTSDSAYDLKKGIVAYTV